MREIIIRNIDNAPNGKEFFAGISGNFKDFGQTLCELIDNPISNFRAHGIHGRVEIVLEEQGDHVDVMVRDNGTGIENMDAALTIAARSCAESTLNEHGMGLKHALASINAGENQHWSIQTRTAEDVANDRYQRAEGPYDIHMPVSMIPGSGEVAGGTGTMWISSRIMNQISWHLECLQMPRLRHFFGNIRRLLPSGSALMEMSRDGRRQLNL